MPIKLRMALLFVALFLLGCLQACNGCNNIVDEFADEDNDGWFTKPNNLATVLTLKTVSFSHTHQGRYRILIDNVRFPNSTATGSLDDSDPNGWLAVAPTDTATLNETVTTRLQGRNAYTGAGAVGKSTYTSTVRVQGLSGGDVFEVGTTTLTYTSDDAQTLSATVGGGGVANVTLNFTTSTTRFADPNPTNANGDSDGDDITEAEEAQMGVAFGGIGDPRPGSMPDVMLVIGFTEAKWNIDPATAELLKTRFFARGINLQIDNGTLNGHPGIGGMMNLGGTAVAPGTVITKAQAASMRVSNLPAGRRRFTYLALLTAGVAEGGFGLSNGIPGNVFVMRAQIEPLSPNFFNYQAGVLMHEFGHLLGLCHPNTANWHWRLRRDSCCRARPWSNCHGSSIRNPRYPRLPATVINTLRRPLDYSPTQWTLLKPAQVSRRDLRLRNWNRCRRYFFLRPSREPSYSSASSELGSQSRGKPQTSPPTEIRLSGRTVQPR